MSTASWTPAGTPPLSRQRPGEKFWFTEVLGAPVVYCNFRSYDGLADNAAKLLDFVKQKDNASLTLVIDLRQNGGGDFTKGRKHLIEPLKRMDRINRKNHLFVLIGNQTFSAAMSNAAHFRQETNAILVGEPIGEKPNSYQENDRVLLPNSHLVLSYSTRFYEFAPSGENLIRPDQLVETSWEDFKSGRDPVLEWVIEKARS